MAEPTPSRPMKYPYTFTARIAQFPYKHYYKHTWVVKYYCISFFLCAPVFYSIQKLCNSPGNIATWEEKKRLEAAGHH